MIYPAFLVGMVLFSLMILLIYVVPQFAPMFADMNVEMPMITKIVLAVGSTLQSFWWLILDRRRARHRLVPPCDGRARWRDFASTSAS